MQRAAKAVLIGAIVGLCGLIACQGNDTRDDAGGGRTMNQAKDEVVRLLSLDDEAYFTIGEEQILDLQAKIAEVFEPEQSEEMPVIEDETPETVLAIGAPKAINVDRDFRLPILGACRYTGQRGWEVNYNQNFWLVASNLSDGSVRLIRPLLKDKRQKTPPPSGTGTPPNNISAVTVTTSVRLFDPQTNMLLNWRPARLALTALVYDWVSNTVMVNLVELGQQEETAEARHRSAFINPTSKVTPDGTAFTHPEQAAAGEPIPVTVQISASKGDVAVCASLGEEGGSLLTATFVLLKLDDRDPARVDIAAPLNTENAEMTEAAFEFNVADALDEELEEGTYLTYLIAGRTIVGPHRLVIGSK